MEKKKIQITYIPISEIIPYEKNPRKNDRAVDVVADSIKQYGFTVPIILDKNNIIIAGHTRLKAAIKLGLKEAPVIWRDDLSESQVKAFRIMDNKSSEYARWDLDLLKTEFEDLKNLQFDLDLTGFSEAEIKRILEIKNEEDYFNREPKYKIMAGEIYQLGNHRVICGDATRQDTYENLLGMKRVAAVYTDPPYGVSYVGVNNPNGRSWKMIENDGLRGDDLFNLLNGTFKAIEPFLQAKAALYVFHASANQTIFEKALNEAGFKVKQQLIWQKHLVLGHSDYHWAHEPIFYCSRKNEEPEFYGDRVDKTMINKIDPDKMNEKQLRDFVKRTLEQSSIWQFKKDASKDYIHPTQKPVWMAQRAIINSSKPGDIVLDPFGGSGSTLLAAQEEERACYLIEIDPVYCSHIIERWENKYGQKAEKLTFNVPPKRTPEDDDE